MADAPALWTRLRQRTSARIGLAQSGAAIATSSHLAFQRDHARARDAVHEALDARPLLEALRARGFETLHLASAARDRRHYLLRPDLGRTLDAPSREKLAQPQIPCDLAFVLADGLSALALARHALPVIDALRPALSEWRLGPAAVVEQGRVAIGDEIGEALFARMVAVFIGERPGLSSPDSLGIYVTWAPRRGRTHAERNCISNIRPEGMGYSEAAAKLVYLLGEARRRALTGITLKDETPALERLDEPAHVSKSAVDLRT